MKKLLSATFAVIISLFLCFPVTLSARAASLAKVTFNDAASRKGEHVEIIVNLSNCQKIKSMAVVPLYDSGRLDYVSGEWLIGGALLSDWDQDEQNGVILYSSETDVNGDIAKFVFKLTDNDAWEDIDFSCKVVLKNGNSAIEVEVDSLKISIICDHIWDDEIHTKNSTCAEEGYTYKLCAICNRENKLTDIEKIAHNVSDWIIDKESNINEEGLKHKECIECKEIIEEEVIPILGQCNHIWGEEVFIQESTCSELGMVYNICQLCKEKNKLFDINKTVHFLSDWIVDKEPTTEEEGECHKECLNCGFVFEKCKIPCLVEQGMKPWVVAVISIGTGIGVGLIVLGICFLVIFKRKN